MTVSDIVTQLKYGELRSIAVKDDIPAIVSYINLALIELYDRFKLSVKEQLIPMTNNIVEYNLNDDLMAIEAIYDENGDEFALDDTASLFSIMQVGYNTIQVPNPVTGSTISVVYLSSPSDIVYDSTDSETINASLATIIPLPPQLIEPLLHYIGYRAHGSMNGDIKAENNTHYMRYEASCKKLQERGSVRQAIPGAHVSLAESISDEDILYQDTEI